MFTLIGGAVLSLWGGGSLLALALRYGFLPAFMSAIPMVVRVLDFCLETLIGFFRLLGKAFTVANSNPPVYVLLLVAFLGGGVYYGEWRPWMAERKAAKIERVQGKKVVKPARPSPEGKFSPAKDDFKFGS